MNLQKELKTLKERIAELEEQAKEEREFPQDGDKYWCIDDEGGVLSSTYDSHYIDINRQMIGNIFQTGEQAKFAVEKLKVEAELRKFSKPFVDGKENNHIKYRPNFDELSVSASYGYQDQGVFYFESREKAQQAIQSVGKERVKKYLFGVEEGDCND